MTEPLRVACLGAGYFSQFHRDGWERIERATLVGVADNDVSAARATGIPAFENLDDMLAALRPDLLDIITPPDGHAEAIRTGLRHGVSTIVCQKPFCADLDQAKTLVSEAKDADISLIVHENFRFQPWFRKAKEALDQGLIGDLQQMTFRLRPGDGQGPRAYLDRQPYFQKMDRFLIHETAVHYIDVFRFLFGRPTAVYADLRRLNPAIAGEDAGFVLFDFGPDRRALFDGNRHLDHKSDNPRRTMGEALIEGSGGTLEILGDGAVLHRRFGAANETVLLGPDTSTTFGGDCVHRLQSHIIAGVLDGEPLENLAEDYLNVLQIEQAIYASASTGNKATLSP